jgi:hypothetical protein
MEDIPHRELGIRKLSPPWVPHFLRKPAKAACVEASKEIL